SLRYEGPGTELTLGLPAGTIWIGGSAGGSFVPNIPTEEVFCGPHRLTGDGVVTATKPLSLFGNLVEDFSFVVSGGRIVEATAATGQAVLDQLLATDDGSVRFGECAMVPMSSAVAAERLVWNNTLYDENDGCHIAIGRAYPINVEGGTAMSADELLAAGLNQSTTHVDFVVGSPDLDVFGATADGSEEPIISNGEWGFTP
ncbi:MAG: aminopeptidase, partial [Acidimicrobiia bacterium]|nr:aminopeptidase [Acidimicrobiia bacterium]